MGYLDSNYSANTHGTKGAYKAPEHTKAQEEKVAEKQVGAAQNNSAEVSPEAALGYLGAMGMQNQALIKIAPKQVKLSELNGAEFEKAIEALTKKYETPESIARIEASMEEYASKLEDNKNFAMQEFPDLSEGTAEALALSGMNAMV